MKTSTTLLLTLVLWIVSIIITWGEVAFVLLIIKWIGVKFAFFKWSILLTLIVLFIEGIFRSKTSD